MATGPGGLHPCPFGRGRPSEWRESLSALLQEHLLFPRLIRLPRGERGDGGPVGEHRRVAGARGAVGVTVSSGSRRGHGEPRPGAGPEDPAGGVSSILFASL